MYCGTYPELKISGMAFSPELIQKTFSGLFEKIFLTSKSCCLFLKTTKFASLTQNVNVLVIFFNLDQAVGRIHSLFQMTETAFHRCSYKRCSANMQQIYRKTFIEV